MGKVNPCIIILRLNNPNQVQWWVSLQTFGWFPLYIMTIKPLTDEIAHIKPTVRLPTFLNIFYDEPTQWACDLCIVYICMLTSQKEFRRYIEVLGGIVRLHLFVRGKFWSLLKHFYNNSLHCLYPSWTLMELPFPCMAVRLISGFFHINVTGTSIFPSIVPMTLS